MSRQAFFAAPLLLGLVTACTDHDARVEPVTGNTGIRLLSIEANEGFARANEARTFVFPEDHGAHPEYRTEWWYFTGNLFGDEGRHYGFELTFFRMALTPETPTSDSAWSSNQFWMAHFALTDTVNERFLSDEKLSRGALDLAGARHSPLRVWVENWSAEGDLGESGSIRLRAENGEAAIDLELTALKPPIPQGDNGLDAKGPERGNASFYYSMPRFAAAGSVRAGEEPAEAAEGLAWMDREWGSSTLGRGVVGWDWFALQLSDGRDLMYYRLRTGDGSVSPFSGGRMLFANGVSAALTPADVLLEPLESWQSPESGRRYPVAWRMSLPAEDLVLELRPRLAAQEVNLSVRYWEGAVTVEAVGSNGALTGNGYLELAGY